MGDRHLEHLRCRVHSRITKLEEQLEEVTKRKSRKRKQIRQGDMMEYGTMAAQVAAEASIALQASKNARGGGGHQRAQRGIRRCGNCGGARHNARTCKKGIEEPS